MISSEHGDLYEVACLDCKTSRSYFTAQGVSYFKWNHDGHNVKVSQPGEVSAEGTDSPMSIEARETPSVTQVVEILVDVVGSGSKRKIRVFGVTEAKEGFSKTFNMTEVYELNEFLESGSHLDKDLGVKYSWAAKMVNIPTEVLDLLDDVKKTETKAAKPKVRVQQKEAEKIPLVPQGEEAPQIDVRDLLLSSSAYIKEGERYQLEAIRISRVLAKFRWKVEPPYVIGEIFDNLLSIESKGDRVEASLIGAMTELGYAFVAFEAPDGRLTAWFRASEAAKLPKSSIVPPVAAESDEPRSPAA
jgi:hypothetical protein